MKGDLEKRKEKRIKEGKVAIATTDNAVYVSDINKLKSCITKTRQIDIQCTDYTIVVVICLCHNL